VFDRDKLATFVQVGKVIDRPICHARLNFDASPIRPTPFTISHAEFRSLSLKRLFCRSTNSRPYVWSISKRSLKKKRAKKWASLAVRLEDFSNGVGEPSSTHCFTARRYALKEAQLPLPNLNVEDAVARSKPPNATRPP
jgi:hypothetical protein